MDTETLPLPLHVTGARYGAYHLVLNGPSWTLSVRCQWRWVTPIGDIISATTDDPETRIHELVGDELIAVIWFGPAQFGFDPTFHLASGGELTLLSDAAEDNWALSTAGELLLGPVRP